MENIFTVSAIDSWNKMQDQMGKIANLKGCSLKNSLKVTELSFFIELLFIFCVCMCVYQCVCVCVCVCVCMCVCTNLPVRAILAG